MIADVVLTLIAFGAGIGIGAIGGWLLGVTRYFGVRQ